MIDNLKRAFADPYAFDVMNYERITLAVYESRYGLAARLWYQLRIPYWLLVAWMLNWDTAFHSRYLDRKREQNPERYIQ